MVECFASQFAKSFVVSSNDSRDADHVIDSAGLFSVDCFEEFEILRGFKRVKANFSAGPDGVPGFLAFDCRFAFVEPMKHIFKLIADSSSFPSMWKTSRIVPVFKKGNKCDVSNYRPIAILSNFSKVFEFCLHKKIWNQVKGVISERQHGFVSRRSTFCHYTVYLRSVR